MHELWKYPKHFFPVSKLQHTFHAFYHLYPTTVVTQQSLLVVPFPFGALETSVPDINQWQISASPVIIKCSLAQALDMSGKMKGIVSVKQSKMSSGFIGLRYLSLSKTQSILTWPQIHSRQQPVLINVYISARRKWKQASKSIYMKNENYLIASPQIGPEIAKTHELYICHKFN